MNSHSQEVLFLCVSYFALWREVAGDVQDEVGGVGGEGVDASVGGGTMAMLEVIAPSLAFKVETSGCVPPLGHSVR